MSRLLSILKGDGFSCVELTDSINRLPFRPTRLGESGMFEEVGVTTTSIDIELQDGILAIIPDAPRQAPGPTVILPKARGVSLKARNIPLRGTVMADDGQDLRGFGGGMDEMESAAKLVERKLTVMRNSAEVTFENMRAGAIKGQVVDHDGTELVNLFTTFGLPKIADVDFILGTGTTDIRGILLDLKGKIEEACGGFWPGIIRAFCGPTFFKRFTGHATVKASFENYSTAGFLREDRRFKGFEYVEGVIFEQYRAKVGTRSFIGDTECRIVPEIPGLFTHYMAPAPIMQAMNTLGQKLYVTNRVLPHDEGIELKQHSCPLIICKRPDVLVRGVTSN